MTRRTPICFVMAFLAIGLAVASCGGGEDADDEGVATLQEDRVADADGPRRQDIETAVLEFTACMRDEGVEVPDIELDADGAPLLDAATLQGIDLESDDFQAAFSACIGIITDAAAFEFDFDPEIDAIIQDQLQAFAECMRREGITDFPDPIGGGAGTPFPLSAFTNLADESFQTALATCQQESTFTGLTE